MSNVQENASTTPAQRSSPNAARTAARKVNSVPTTVIWLGVTGRRPNAAINRSAWRRTQASNRVVNMALHRTSRCRARLFVHLDHLRRHRRPRVLLGLLESSRAHAAPQLGVAGQDDQGRAQLGPALGANGEAVLPGLEH